MIVVAKVFSWLFLFLIFLFLISQWKSRRLLKKEKTERKFQASQSYFSIFFYMFARESNIWRFSPKNNLSIFFFRFVWCVFGKLEWTKKKRKRKVWNWKVVGFINKNFVPSGNLKIIMMSFPYKHFSFIFFCEPIDFSSSHFLLIKNVSDFFSLL